MSHKLVVHGAMLECDQGVAPSSLVVPPALIADDDNQIATINDHVAMVNIMPFGMCRSMANPQVAAVTAAAGGVLTPQPCVPVVPAPWAPGSSIVTVDDVPAVLDDARCACQWAGQISITSAGSDVDAD